MYYTTSAPMAMGIGGGYTLDFFNVINSMSAFWIVLATFAIIAMFSAIRRSVPKAMIVIPDDDPTPDAPTPVDDSWREHAFQ